MVAAAFLLAILLQAPPEVSATFDGVFQAVSKGFVEIQVAGGENMRMHVTGATRLVRNGKSAKAKDFHAGDRVAVEARRDVLMNLVAMKVELVSDPKAEEIMRRVAENQDRAQTARASYVYDMNVFVRMKRGNGKTAREESRDYVVLPGETGATREIAKREGTIYDGKKTIVYSDLKYEEKDNDIDGGITDAFASNVLWKKGTFGPSVQWFPIEKENASKYRFTMLGEEMQGEHPVYRISYKQNEADDSNCWQGEALIHREEMQPVLITSEWACKIPAAVKIMLGINVQHVGAKISYERFDKDLWFPMRAGGEMKIRLFFLYARTIAFNAANKGFRKADVKSTVAFGEEAQ